jgi:short-subunit dehydrogenase
MTTAADRPHRTALVTGASSGIGRALGLELAKRGSDIVVVARREVRLKALADEIARRHGVAVTVWAGDLADPEAPARLVRDIQEQGIAVDILVNNAGFGVPGMLVDVDWSRHRACLEVMTAAPVHLCQLLAPPMMERGWGRIINVASLSALLPPHAGGTLYYPVKSFMLQFSLAIREEMRPGGVRVTALCPGFTDTDFQQAAGGTVESVAFPRALWSRPESVAVAAVEAVESDRAICIPGLVNKAIAVAFKLMPGALGRWLVRGES